ncbi:D-alanine--D-alanine ligase family protein [Clostridiisalibacter paucivorans]|uniref:D-alanine--D-alanine ligase family protein n=1 Tax=Clostridiisalibacter paucivorans TaxID=408753 RepID=UPI00047E7750|nr:D-alanine--D-alanine ligase family protein [Clostridiisalibacter paucivorans]
MKKRVGVLFGGRTVEHEVSVITGLQVMENMDKTKYEPVPIYIDKKGKWYTGEELKKFDTFKNKEFGNTKEIVITATHDDKNLYNHPNKIGMFSKKVLDSIDVIFPAMHGTNGEDGTIQGILELINVPYVGAGVMSSAVGMDKIIMKSVFKAEALPIVDHIWFYRKKWIKDRDTIIKDVEDKLEYPVFVKPANLGSSVGITKATDVDKLIDAIEVAIRYDRKILVENAVVNPREINCAVMGKDDELKASFCEEPLGWKDLLSYEDKYINSDVKGGKGQKRVIPAELSDKMTEDIQNFAKRAFNSLDCRGNARIDFLIDENDNIFVNEINTLPGSVAFYLWEPMGITFKDMITELIDIAEDAHGEKNDNMYSYDVDLFNKKANIGGVKK